MGNPVSPVAGGGSDGVEGQQTDRRCLTPARGYESYPVIQASMKRKILVIMSNRLNRSQKARYLELDCDDKGTILKERPLRREPAEPRFDEVWENDEGKTSFTSCHRFKRKYRHRLERRKAAG
jgi:hypothetical protein